MITTRERNPRAKFNRWLENRQPIPFVLDEPKRPAAFHSRNRLKALTEPAIAEIYVLSLPTRPAA